MAVAPPPGRSEAAIIASDAARTRPQFDGQKVLLYADTSAAIWATLAVLGFSLRIAAAAN
jgi:hypothetical protein